MIYFITADRDKGKTTYLQHLAKQQPERFGGILSVAGPNKEAYYAFNIETEERQLLMSCDGNTDIKIGKFYCNQEAFNWASKVIISTRKPAIIIDEVGRLELRDEGFATALSQKIKSSQDIYLAVRTPFLEAIIQHFNIKEYRVVEVKREG